MLKRKQVGPEVHAALFYSHFFPNIASVNFDRPARDPQQFGNVLVCFIELDITGYLNLRRRKHIIMGR